MLSLRWDSNPQCLGFETTEHLRNRMRNENCRKTSLKRLQLTLGRFIYTVVGSSWYYQGTRLILLIGVIRQESMTGVDTY